MRTCQANTDLEGFESETWKDAIQTCEKLKVRLKVVSVRSKRCL